MEDSCALYSFSAVRWRSTTAAIADVELAVVLAPSRASTVAKPKTKTSSPVLSPRRGTWAGLGCGTGLPRGPLLGCSSGLLMGSVAGLPDQVSPFLSSLFLFLFLILVLNSVLN
jgi:hypothetical protein